MSHNLEIKNGEASMMYYGEVPWHGLGVSLNKPATAEEALKLAGLNFQVEKVPTFYNYNDRMAKMEDRFAIVRKDTQMYLGNVGARYTPVQNSDLFTFFDPIVDRDEAIYHTAGVIDDGRKIWLLAKMPDHITIKDEKIEKYVLLHSAHDGSSPLIAKLTPVRVVCNNTLSTALSEAGAEVRIKHTKTVLDRLEEAHNVLQIVNKVTEQLSTIFTKMSEVQLRGNVLDDYLAQVFPGTVNPETNEVSTRTKNTREKVRELVTVGIGMDSDAAKNTLWGAYNAVVEYADHSKFDGGDSPNDRADSIWFGSSRQLTDVAFEKALAFLN